MEYLLDANVLMDANRDYYALDRVPEFWDWLIYHGQQGDVKIPIEIYEEIIAGDDELRKWTKRQEVKDALLLSEEVNIDLVRKVVNEGYASDLDDTEIEKLGRDPFLIARGLDLTSIQQRCIVSTESSASSKMRANRRIPDICKAMGVEYCTAFHFYEFLDFRTNWKVPQTD